MRARALGMTEPTGGYDENARGAAQWSHSTGHFRALDGAVIAGFQNGRLAAIEAALARMRVNPAAVPATTMIVDRRHPDGAMAGGPAIPRTSRKPRSVSELRRADELTRVVAATTHPFRIQYVGARGCEGFVPPAQG